MGCEPDHRTINELDDTPGFHLDGRALSNWRAMNGIAQRSVADYLGVVAPFIVYIEKGDQVTESRGLSFLAAVDYLVGRRERMIREAFAEKVAS